ncbi:Tobamovirus multiplication protein [Actinidia chinensis var. chinensis]|uniref:Tobamovirus multiplication protein n=1 Tax=Actinidia chinensis var. chinensis TaxID=1590841 RepID=A0A2R6Q6Q1_ACTCC|nr:Tobamovirus multiplication protein [Actinidia chinensis var. chinensis]
MFELRDGSCYPKALAGMNVALACIGSAISVLAFYQLIRIQARNSHVGWTRQKVFHLMIGLSNMGYFVYFVLTLVAACKGWLCWSHSCGFIFMASPEILFLAAFLLLLSFWVDLCHQANDEDEEDEECSPQEALLEKTSNKPHSIANSHRKCCSFRAIHVGSRQKVVILVIALIFIIMIASAVLIWIGLGRNPIDSAVVARVYVDLFAITILLLGGALACYGLVLFLKMKKVRSERAASETRKVAGLAVVSVLCFTSRALVALFTDIPMFYHWHGQHVNGVYTSLLLILYYFIGSSIPSAFVLWVMRELPPSVVVNVQEESRIIAFIHDSSVTLNPRRWTAAASSQNQASRASPI